MRIDDQFEYTVTLSDKSALTHWNNTILAFLAHSAATPEHLAKTLEADPDFALAQAARGLFCLLLGRREMTATAFEAYAIADKCRRDTQITDREEAVVEALNDWLQGTPTKSADRLDELLLKYPRDAFLLKLVHAIRFVLGQPSRMRSSIEGVISSYEDDHIAKGYVHGCYSFALEETGDFDRAERIGKEAVAFQHDDAWGLHAVAHVLDMTGQTEEGIKWLDDQPKAWEHCNNFGYHVWWHLALLHLDRGNVERVFELYDQKFRKDHTDDYRDISNAASMLVRLELEGIKVGNRWEELASISEKRIDDSCNVFADLHYMLALLGDNRRQSSDRLLTRMRTFGEQDTNEMGLVTKTTGSPTASGLMQFKNGNYFSAYHHLAEARPLLRTVGGSHAQRDVFERLTIEAALRAGLCQEAKRMIDERTRLRGGSDTYGETRMAQATRMTEATDLMQSEHLRFRMG
ncbi:tetratricopeptide repeat protein [Pseudovibrio sp. POLY-S9]|uniref:tetratricopeptide repeat protein n=1 Tax=Pseudovibrio sp. POLY-S9 TaxID=1576596 RepID=UPI00070DEC8B|nr:tetratricopeptide repeat protein [Pseudovibrio sp. POLY-S9]